ncbi:hypothetical protein MHF_0491 [Mycoplasma haemofelis Ohio2]|uniref:Uncharacterized protein n=1 Tax=Mycoplasma haemofelis (strain Ohio2) TaxID=859194 RepID=F6FHM4_MYCHI|nr:hypothetical protein MHF_0491 [Mycoplasma haemofelis Ohio2]
MALSPLTKGGIALAGGGGTATGGYLIYSHINSEIGKIETFKSKVEESGRSLIIDNDSQWGVKASLYGKPNNIHKIRINNEEKATVNKEELKAWCNKNLDLPYSPKSHSILFLIEKWCITPSIKEALLRESKGLIPVEGNLDSEWSQKISEKSSTVKSDLIDKLHLSNEDNTTVKPETLRDWCKSNIELEYISEDGNNYALSKEWCLQK